MVSITQAQDMFLWENLPTKATKGLLGRARILIIQGLGGH